LHKGLLLVIRELLERATQMQLLAAFGEGFILKFPLVRALPPNLLVLSLRELAGLLRSEVAHLFTLIL
jgi:hypothetical protein